MNTPFFISWRYQRGKQKNPLVALISKFSAIGIALGVAVLIVGLSAMNGFERELNSRILAVVPHVEITVNTQGNDPTLNHWQKLAERLKRNKKIINYIWGGFLVLSLIIAIIVLLLFFHKK